nr:adenylate/guanylate cyclase domain-containing protein [Leptospira limi]
MCYWLGLHTGNVIYGDIGHSEFKSQTVLGDVVNVASRLEALNKKVNLENSNGTTDEGDLVPLHQILESIIDKLNNPKSLKKEILKLANQYQKLSIPREIFSKLVSVYLNTLEESSSDLWNHEISLVSKEVWTDTTIQLIES